MIFQRSLRPSPCVVALAFAYLPKRRMAFRFKFLPAVITFHTESQSLAERRKPPILETTLGVLCSAMEPSRVPRDALKPSKIWRGHEYEFDSHTPGLQ
jgi:hypothetical protein